MRLTQHGPPSRGNSTPLKRIAGYRAPLTPRLARPSRNIWRRGRDSNPGHRGYPCTAFPVPHLRPLGHPSMHREKLAEGRGFEPPRDLLGPYPISSRTPSTGLGHPSALIAQSPPHLTRPSPVPPLQTLAPRPSYVQVRNGTPRRRAPNRARRPRAD